MFLEYWMFLMPGSQYIESGSMGLISISPIPPILDGFQKTPVMPVPPFNFVHHTSE